MPLLLLLRTVHKVNVFMVFDKVCDSLNVIGPYKLIGSGITRRCGFVGVGMALLEEVCHCRVGFEVSYAQDITQCLRLLPVVCR